MEKDLKKRKIKEWTLTTKKYLFLKMNIALEFGFKRNKELKFILLQISAQAPLLFPDLIFDLPL